jgi:hypothetical protein
MLNHELIIVSLIVTFFSIPSYMSCANRIRTVIVFAKNSISRLASSNVLLKDRLGNEI